MNEFSFRATGGIDRSATTPAQFLLTLLNFFNGKFKKLKHSTKKVSIYILLLSDLENITIHNDFINYLPRDN